MLKQKNQVEDSSSIKSPQDNGLPVPFSLDKLRGKILALYFQQIRMISWMAGNATIGWRIIDKPADAYESDLFAPDLDPEHIGLKYDAIRTTHFAECIEKMYQYAYFGILDESGEQMDYESVYTWMTSILNDMKNSRMFYELETYGSFSLGDAEECFQVAELANARRVLEGGKNFFYFGMNNKDDDSTGENGLTVRQMALLSGMEEMSIRAAANPKRATPLLTYSEEGRTRISIQIAKAWLQAKGRYVAITRRWGEGEIDLEKRRFASIEQLAETLESRIQMLTLRDPSGDALKAGLAAVGITVSFRSDAYNNPFELDMTFISDVTQIRKLAELLELPPDLLVLRTREARAKEELISVERELRILVESQKEHGVNKPKGKNHE